MRVLLDESLPRQLARELRGHEVSTVVEQRWTGCKNSWLLPAAREAGFEVLVTADQSLEYQQNVVRFGLGVIVLKAVSNRIQDLVPLVLAVLEVLPAVQPGQVDEIPGARSAV